MMMSYEEVLKT